MKKVVQLFKQEPLDINNIEWFLLTQTNFQINGRRLYNKKKGGVDLNPHFLFDKLKSIDEFNVYYISSFTDVKKPEKIDYDFQVGFNNLGSMLEQEIITTFAVQNDIELIIRPRVHSNDYLNIPPLFNTKSEEYIENKYNVIYKNLDKIPTFIIKLNNLSQLLDLNEYIYSYLINPLGSEHINLTKIKSFYELDVLDFLMNTYEVVCLRTSVFANYNLTMYTRYLDALKVSERLKKCAKKMDIEFQEKIAIGDKNNLLKYW